MRAKLADWTHRDWGEGTDKGSNADGYGLLFDHDGTNAPLVAGVKCMGLTCTSKSAAAGIPNGSNAVYLWDPIESFDYSPTDLWMRTGLFFPSAASSAFFAKGESAYTPTTGNWNHIFELHKQTVGSPNLSFLVMTNYPVDATKVGGNPRFFMRVETPAGVDTYVDILGNAYSGSGLGQQGTPIPFDTWIDLIIECKLDASNGKISYYVNGQQVWTASGIATLEGVGQGVNLTVANNRMAVNWSSTYFMRAFAEGPTLASVQAAF